MSLTEVRCAHPQLWRLSLLVCCVFVAAGSLGPSTWLPWLVAMGATMLLFSCNGLYQYHTWWLKGGSETVFEDVDPVAREPSSVLSGQSHLGDSFQVRTRSC